MIGEVAQTKWNVIEKTLVLGLQLYMRIERQGVTLV